MLRVDDAAVRFVNGMVRVVVNGMVRVVALYGLIGAVLGH